MELEACVEKQVLCRERNGNYTLVGILQTSSRSPNIGLHGQILFL